MAEKIVAKARSMNSARDEAKRKLLEKFGHDDVGPDDFKITQNSDGIYTVTINAKKEPSDAWKKQNKDTDRGIAEMMERDGKLPAGTVERWFGSKAGTKSALEQEVQKASEPVAAGSDATTAAIGDSTGTKFGVSTSDRGDYSEDDLSDLDAKIEELKPADLKKIVREIATEEIEAPPTWESETVAPPPTMASETIAPEPTMESETVRGVDPKSGISARLASDDERANFKRQLQSQIEQPRDTRGGPNMTTPVGSTATPAAQAMPDIGTAPTSQASAGEQGLLDKWKSVLSGESEFSLGGLSEEERAAFAKLSPSERMGLDPNLPAQQAPQRDTRGGPNMTTPVGNATQPETSRPSVPLRGSMGPGMGDAQHGNMFKQPPPEPLPTTASAADSGAMASRYENAAGAQTNPYQEPPKSLDDAVKKAFQPDPNAMRTEDITNAMAPIRNFNWNRSTTPAPPPAAPEPGPQMPNEREMRGQALMDSMASRAQTQASQAQGTAAQRAMEAQMTQNDSGSSYQQSRAVEKEGPGLGGKAKGILGKIRDFVDKGADTPAAKYSLDPRKRTREEQQELEAWMAAGRPNDWNWEPRKAIGRRPKLTGSLR